MKTHKKLLGKTGSKEAKQPERISLGFAGIKDRIRCHWGKDMKSHLLTRHFFQKPCTSGGLAANPVTPRAWVHSWWLGRQRRKITPEQGTRKIPDPRLCWSSRILGEAGSFSLTSPSRDVKQSQPKGGGNKMVKPWGPGIQKPPHESGPKQQRNQKPRKKGEPRTVSLSGVRAPGKNRPPPPTVGARP